MAGRAVAAALFLGIALVVARIVWNALRSGRIYLRPLGGAVRGDRPMIYWALIGILLWGVMWGVLGAAAILFMGRD
jgi:hypothetical protein